MTRYPPEIEREVMADNHARLMGIANSIRITIKREGIDLATIERTETGRPK